jgi:trigger factor
MVAEVIRGKALARIVESATVTDKSGNHVELANLRPDGSIGEPEAQTEAQTETQTEAPAESGAPVESEAGAEAEDAKSETDGTSSPE